MKMIFRQTIVLKDGSTFVAHKSCEKVHRLREKRELEPASCKSVKVSAEVVVLDPKIEITMPECPLLNVTLEEEGLAALHKHKRFVIQFFLAVSMQSIMCMNWPDCWQFLFYRFLSWMQQNLLIMRQPLGLFHLFPAALKPAPFHCLILIWQKWNVRFWSTPLFRATKEQFTQLERL